jgi:hypothetical protein
VLKNYSAGATGIFYDFSVSGGEQYPSFARLQTPKHLFKDNLVLYYYYIMNIPHKETKL